MAPRVFLDKSKCISCGLCTKVCTKKILSLNDDKNVSIMESDDWGCCACGLCMSVCPTEAISVNGLDYGNFKKLRTNDTTYSDLEILLSSRRSIRCFSDRNIDEDVLNQIIHMSALAPIGAPPINVKLLVINKPGDLSALRLDVINGWKKMIKAVKNPIYRTIMKKAVGDNKYNALSKHALPAAKLYCHKADNGKDVFTFSASAILLFYGEKLGVCINENSWLSCSYAVIAAHALGLGATISGMIPPIVNMNKERKSKLGILRNEEIFACLMLGYPDESIKFKRTIPRLLKEIRFVK